jgi:hypothetical protein
VCDAVEAQPVAAELQPDDLLAPIGRHRDDLEEARVQDVEVAEALAGLIQQLAGVHEVALRRERVAEQLQRVGDALAGALVRSGVVPRGDDSGEREDRAGGSGRGGVAQHGGAPEDDWRFDGVNARKAGTTGRQRRASLRNAV